MTKETPTFNNNPFETGNFQVIGGRHQGFCNLLWQKKKKKKKKKTPRKQFKFSVNNIVFGNTEFRKYQKVE